MELRQGVYTYKKIAEWFNMSYSTLVQNRKKYLEELKEYAIFEFTDKNKINILSVKKPIHIDKKEKALTCKKIEKKISRYWNRNGLDLKENAICRLYSKEEFEEEFETIYNYALEVIDDFWGKPESLENGIKGNCYWILCVKNINTNQLRFFTNQEKEWQKKYREKYFNEKKLEMKAQREIRESLALQKKEKIITIEEYNAKIIELQNSIDNLYFDYLEELQNILSEDEKVTYGIYVEDKSFLKVRGNSFFKENE